MNTSKQVNVMIGFLFLAFIAFGAYFAWEPSREAAATEEQMTTFAVRGANIFVANCRTCHGLEGKGPEEGGVGPVLNTDAFLILEEDNEFGLPPTPAGEAQQIRTFLTNTLACGRTNTFMPAWAQQYGGPLQTIQIEYVVSLMTQGRWDLVHRLGEEHDEELGINPEEVVVRDPSGLSVTQNNCGQYSAATASAIRQRDPFAAPGSATPPPASTAAPGPSAPVEGATPIELAEFSVIATDATSAPAGNVAFNVHNVGAILHNLRVVKSDLPADQLPQAGGQVDESAVDVKIRIDDIAGGETKSGQGDLEAGNYVLICNIPGHYQLGMHSAFTVQ